MDGEIWPASLNFIIGRIDIELETFGACGVSRILHNRARETAAGKITKGKGRTCRPMTAFGTFRRRP